MTFGCDALRLGQAAALYIAGFEQDARLVMAKFKWGDSFFQLNGEYLDRYAECDDSADVIRVQNEIMAMIEEEKVTRAAEKAANTDNDYGGNFGILSSSEEEYEYEPQPAAAAGLAEPPQLDQTGDDTGSFGLGQLAEAQAQRLARLQHLAQPPPPVAGIADALQDTIDDDFGEEPEPELGASLDSQASPQGTTSADSTDSADPVFDASTKMLTPALLHNGGDTGSSVAYPPPAAPESAYSPPVSGDLVDVPVNTCRPGLLFDDSWMDDTPEGGCSVIGEYKDDDDVLDKIDERERQQREAAAATAAAAAAASKPAPVLDEI